MLGAKQEVAVVVAEGAPGHGRVDHVDVQRDSVADVGIAGAGERVQAVDEICGFGGWRDGEGRPFCLFGQEGNGGVQRKKTVFYVCFCFDCFVAI